MTSRNFFAKATSRDHGGPGIVPIVVRFVPHDQWFSTHVASSWTIAQAKAWIIAKCFNDTDTLRILYASLIVSSSIKTKPHQSRPISPIIFANTRPKSRSSMFGDDDDDFDKDEDPNFCGSDEDRQRSLAAPPSRPTNPYVPHPRTVENVFFPPSSNVSSRPSISSVWPEQPIDYCLLSFSTSNILEDRYPVSWYNIRPHELLEVHPVGTFIRLPRDISPDFFATLAASVPTSKQKTGNDLSSLSYSDTSTKASSGLDEYIKPYFQVSVKVLRVIRQPSLLLQQGSLTPSPAKEEALSPPLTSTFTSSPFQKAAKSVKSTRPYNYDTSTTTEGTMLDLFSTPTDLLSEVGHITEVNKAFTNMLTSSAKRKANAMSDLGRTQFAWQDRWIIVRDGVLILCEKKEDVKSPSYSSSLSSIVALRGSEHLVNNLPMFSSSILRGDKNMQNRIICIKFLTRSESSRKTSAVSFVGRDNDDLEKKGKKAYHVPGLDDDSVFQTASSSGGSDDGRDKEDAVWLVIDALNETVFEHLLRVLHRSACCFVNSSFLTQSGVASYQAPSRLASDTSDTSITSSPSFSSSHQNTNSSASNSISGSVSSNSPEHAFASGIQDASLGISVGSPDPPVRPSHRRRDSRQSSYGSSWNFASCLMYPDWRSEAVLRAWRAGLNIERGMELLYCGNMMGSEDDEVERGREKKKRSWVLQESRDVRKQHSDKPKTTALENSTDHSTDIMDEEDSEISEDTSSDDHESSLSSSEIEWKGWRQDLQRQWTSMMEKSVQEQPAEYKLGIEDDDGDEAREEWVRRRVQSDVGRPPSPLSLTVPDIAAALNDDSVLPRLMLALSAVTPSTASVGRLPGTRTRSSTVTESSHKKEIKEGQTQTKKNGKQNDQSVATPTGNSSTIWRTSTLLPEDFDITTVDTTTQASASSRPVSTVFSTVDPASSNVEQTSFADEHGEDVKVKSKKVIGLNNIMRGVSMRASAAKSKAKAVF